MLVKRTLDIFISLLGLIFVGPILTVIALMISLESRGGPFYYALRVGKGGRPFGMIKFRSMYKRTADDAYQTQTNDPRITPLGKYLRRYSIDEIPQLINVLIGDMSLVGPRPDVPAQRDDYDSETWETRHAVKPGITGLAQIYGRSTITPEDRIHYDLQYAKHASIFLDLKIMFKTVSLVFRKYGTN